MLGDVVFIVVAAADYDEVANILIILRDADEIYGMLAAIHDDGGIDRVRAAYALDAGNSAADGVNIIESDFGIERGGSGKRMHRVRFDDVGADAFDLTEDETPSGRGTGDDEDDAGGADHHAEHGEEGAQLIRAQRVKGDAPGFAA